MRALPSGRSPGSTVKFHHVLLLVSLMTAAWGLLRAQDDSGAPPAPPANGDTPSAPMQDQAAPAPDPAPSAADQGQEFTSDDATGATQGDASFQTFYDALSNQGSWVQSSDYGYVWQPQVNDPNWAPYTQGHWAYTDDGWTWVSDENFGWATYHYGRWVNLDGYGWVWVPGYTWAPAWVSWRYGDGYAGWAPLPPDSFVGVDYSSGDSSADFGYHIGGDADDYYGIGVGYYIFLPVNCLGYRDYRGHYCDRHDNWHLIGHTSNVTNINVNRHHGAGGIGEHHGSGFGHWVTVGGPQLAQVNAVSSTPIQKVTLGHTTQRNGGTQNGNTLAFYAPRVHAPTSGVTHQPSHVAGSLAQVQINHGTDILKPLAVNSHLTPSAATPEQVAQARTASSQIPQAARVVTDASALKPVLQRPISTMTPVRAVTGSSIHPAATPGATYHSTPMTASPGYVPATTPSVPPASGYAPIQPHAQTYAPAPAYAPVQNYAPTRVYPQTGSPAQIPQNDAPRTIYSANPPAQSYTPMREVAPARTYAPQAVYPPAETRSIPVQPGESAVESHTYTRPVAPAATIQAPASVEARGSAPAISAPASSSPGNSMSGASSSGGGAVSAPATRSH